MGSAEVPIEAVAEPPAGRAGASLSRQACRRIAPVPKRPRRAHGGLAGCICRGVDWTTSEAMTRDSVHYPV